ncbi:MAG: M23 family metallopeptidase [Bacteroidetes bacterium]|nr:M23 family metallopeptidase [Bacteroidota bacterium]
MKAVLFCFVGVFFGLFFNPRLSSAQIKLQVPISGSYGREFIIVNYVDWALDSSFRDNHCGTKAYDGHQGTDFALRNFASMDSGVVVNAAANGRVIFVRDGLFDREKTSVISKQLGNYIGITHQGKLQTYYGHLRKNSILVKKGDSVVAGQAIALVGSSGNSESPHLHFELWYDSTFYIDPFSGPCGNSGTYWKSPLAYDTSYAIWGNDGMSNFVCTLDTLKEGLKSKDTFYAKDPAISYWNVQRGIRSGDSLRVDWLDPLGNLWYRYSYATIRDWWLYYYASYINPPIAGLEGKWKVNFFRNNTLVASQAFYFFQRSNSIPKPTEAVNDAWAASYQYGQLQVQTFGKSGDVVVFDLLGKRLFRSWVSGNKQQAFPLDLASGSYIVIFEDQSHKASLRQVHRRLIQVF